MKPQHVGEEHVVFFLAGGDLFSCNSQPIHPWKLTCPLKMDYFSREYIFQPLIFRGHVSFRGCKELVLGPSREIFGEWKFWPLQGGATAEETQRLKEKATGGNNWFMYPRYKKDVIRDLISKPSLWNLMFKCLGGRKLTSMFLFFS